MPRPATLSATTRVLPLRAERRRQDRPAGFADDVCFSGELVAAFVHAYTEAGDLVLDPFAGFGTTLRTAEELGRRAYGIEIDEDRVAFARARLREPDGLQAGDVRHLDWERVPRFRLSISSPPYMTAHDHPQNPLSGYATLDGDYRRYLHELGEIYGHLAGRAASADSRIVVNVANLPGTELARDLGRVLADVLVPEREIVLDWDEPPDGLTEDLCLVFRPPTPGVPARSG